jgi:hypothetical protein
MDLKNATILGYYKLPSLYLAEHNTEAYNNALRDAPAGAGTCAHCGRGIIHNVIIRDAAGARHCIGTDCAEKVGADREAPKFPTMNGQTARLNAAEWLASHSRHNA